MVFLRRAITAIVGRSVKTTVSREVDALPFVDLLRSGVEHEGKALGWIDLPCPDCGAVMILKDGRFGKYFGCIRIGCDGSHSATEEGFPLGIPGNRETRKWRGKAHGIFDSVWKSKKVNRFHCYAMLADYMGMTQDECHISRFDIEQCKQVIEFAHKARKVYGLEKENEVRHHRKPVQRKR